MSATSSAQRRIARLAALTAVHRAFRWLHLHQPQLRQWQLELVSIPAPPFGESARAAWFLDRFQQLGLTNPHLDNAGNVLAELAPNSSSTPYSLPPVPCILLSAHLDTRVTVNLGSRKGRVVIEFASLEDLERIYRAMTEPNTEPDG